MIFLDDQFFLFVTVNQPETRLESILASNFKNAILAHCG
jgi:hypothetical protein